MSHVVSISACIYLISRRKHKKGIEEDVTKKRTKKTQKFQRAVVGASLTVSLNLLIFVILKAFERYYI